jgi:cbb3-type cytochrome oxidase subunit 3
MESDRRRELRPKYGHPALLTALLLIGGGVVLWMYTIGRDAIATLVLMVTVVVVFCLQWSAYWRTGKRNKNHDNR